MIRNIVTLLSCFIFFLFKGNAQLAVGGGMQFHMDNFEPESRLDHFNQFVVESNYRLKRLDLSTSLSYFTTSEKGIPGNFSHYEFESFGGPGHNYKIIRSADASFSYTGFRVGVNVAVVDSKRYDLLLGFSRHQELLTKERYSNKQEEYEHTYMGNTITADTTYPAEFPVLKLRPIYGYTTFDIKSVATFGRYQLEAQFRLCVAEKKRVTSYLTNNQLGQGFEVRYFDYGLFISTEFGLLLKYVFP